MDHLDDANVCVCVSERANGIFPLFGSALFVDSLRVSKHEIGSDDSSVGTHQVIYVSFHRQSYLVHTDCDDDDVRS